MRSGRCVLVLGAYADRFEHQELLDVQMDSRRPLGQLRRHEDLDVILLDRVVRRKVLAFEVGVDRHLCGTVSGERWNEVKRHHSTSVPHEFHCFVADADIHTYT